MPASAVDTAHDFVGHVCRIGSAVLLVFLIARAISLEIDTALGQIPVLVRPAVLWLGRAIIAVGSAIILAPRVGMGVSWRIGLDRERTVLVAPGLFAFSRNPSFLGMVAVLPGAFLMAPNTVTGIVLAAAWIMFGVQIRMKEDYLRRTHERAGRGRPRRWPSC